MATDATSVLPDNIGLPAKTALGWQRALIAVGTVWATLLLAFAQDWQAMADQWWNSSTYNHIVLIPPILLWLVWLRVPQLRKLVPQGWWPGLVLFAGAALIWLLGTFAGLTMAREAGAMAMLPASALALLGPRVGAGVLFPMAYMAFLVPFGDELIPPLQLITAKLTIGLIQLSQIKATIDGVFINTPAGLFEVAEACSGVKFLIAMIALGALIANVCFIGWRRRAGFMLLCGIMPVLANGVRAWGTIFVAQYKGAKAAGGFDHIVYGWIFFAVVITLVIGLAWRFFDRAVDDPMIDAEQLKASPLLNRLERWHLALWPVLTVLAALVLAGQGWAAAVDSMAAALPKQIFLPDVPGWTRTAYAPHVWWQPRAQGADHRLLGRYRDARGDQVDVFIAVYAAQGEGREAGGFGEGALTPDSGWDWQAPGPDVADARSDRLLGKGGVGRLAETYYRTGALLTGSNVRLKLANMADRLLIRERPTTLLILSAEDDLRQPAAPAIAAFRQSTGPVDRWMDRVVGLR